MENAWQWAAAHQKIFTHPINKAEYIEINVDQEREKQTRRSSELSSSCSFVLEDHGYLHLHACKINDSSSSTWVDFFHVNLECSYTYLHNFFEHTCLQDSSGSVFDDFQDMTRTPLGTTVKPDGDAPAPAVTSMPNLSKSELFHFENICCCFECMH